MATILRPLGIFRSWPVDPQGVAIRAQDGVKQNLLPLGIPLQVVTFREAFFVPRFSVPSHVAVRAASENGGNQLNLLFAVAPAALPPGVREFPNPAGPAYPVALRTYLLAAQTQLIGQDRFFGGPGQSPANLDWPNPRGPVFSNDFRSWLQNLSETTLAPPPAPPFSPTTDQPNPRGPVFSNELRTWLQSLAESALAPPFYQTDWQNPRGPVFSNELRTWLQNLGESTLAPIVAPPFYLTEHPNPRGYLYPIALRTHLLAAQTQLIGQDSFFYGRGRGPVYDYPNPRGYVPGFSLKTHINNAQVQLIGQDRFFGGPGQPPANLDWPNPRGYIPGISLRFTSNDLLHQNLRPPTTWTTVNPAGGSWNTVTAAGGSWTTVPPATL